MPCFQPKATLIALIYSDNCTTAKEKSGEWECVSLSLCLPVIRLLCHFSPMIRLGTGVASGCNQSLLSHAPQYHLNHISSFEDTVFKSVVQLSRKISEITTFTHSISSSLFLVRCECERERWMNDDEHTYSWKHNNNDRNNKSRQEDYCDSAGVIINVEKWRWREAYFSGLYFNLGFL